MLLSSRSSRLSRHHRLIYGITLSHWTPFSPLYAGNTVGNVPLGLYHDVERVAAKSTVRRHLLLYRRSKYSHSGPHRFNPAVDEELELAG
jgi:hypothetical protein